MDLSGFQTGVDTGRIVDMKVEIAPNTDSHPGLAPILSQALLRALELGLRLPPMTNWGTVRSPQVTNDMRAPLADGMIIGPTQTD